MGYFDSYGIGWADRQAACFFADQGLRVVGIDNDMRAGFFGPDASTFRRESDPPRPGDDR